MDGSFARQERRGNDKIVDERKTPEKEEFHSRGTRELIILKNAQEIYKRGTQKRDTTVKEGNQWVQVSLRKGQA